MDVIHALSLILPALALAPVIARIWRTALERRAAPGRRAAPSETRFPQGPRTQPLDAERVLATVLFLDIVGSTQQVARVGDRKWRAVLDAYHSLVRDELGRFGGREIDTAGDGFVAAFDSPARAILCAREIGAAARSRRVEVRAGLHTGECEVMGRKLGGIALHIGSRVAGKAGPGEILVSRTVRDLVAGSELRFDDRGEHELKGVPGSWQLYAAVL